MQIKAGALKENIVSLISLKGLEYLLNFILLPYLLRILGAERFGAIAFMQGIVQYFVIMVDYGFNLTAPRDVAKAKDSKDIGRIFANVMATKVLICLVVTVIFFTIISLGSFYRKLDLTLFVAIYTMVIGNIIFPIWFFQGIQQMRYITIVNILARVITVILVFVLVSSPLDYIMAAFLQACTMIFAGIFAMGILLKKYPFIFVRPSWSGVKDELKEGWHIFLSTIAINAYTTTNIVILGILTDNTIVGYFSAANKIIDCIKGLQNAITQAVYPHVSRLTQKSKSKTINFLHKFMKIYCGLNLLLSVMLIGLAWLIVKILFGPGYDDSVQILQILGILPFIISLSNIFGIQTLLPFGYQKVFSHILILAAAFSLIMVFPLTYFWQGIGVAIGMVLTEVFITIIMFYFVQYVEKIDIIHNYNLK